MFCFSLPPGLVEEREIEAPGLRRSHPTFPNSSSSSWVPHSQSRQSQIATHSSPAPLVFTFPVSGIFYFRSVKRTSLGTNQWHRRWQGILGNVVELSGRERVAVALCDAIVRTKMQVTVAILGYGKTPRITQHGRKRGCLHAVTFTLPLWPLTLAIYRGILRINLVQNSFLPDGSQSVPFRGPITRSKQFS